MKLKSFRKFATFALVSAAAISVQAATTDPLGGIVIPINGESDTRISVPFSRAVAFEGKVNSISSNVVTALGSPDWADGRFVYGDVDSSNPANTYYLVFLSGALEGAYFEITASGSDTVTLDLDGGSLATVQTEVADGAGLGDIFQIIPYWTPATLFAGSTIPDGIELLLYNNSAIGAFKQPTVLTYFEGFGWFNSGSPADDTLLELGQGILVRTPPMSASFNMTVSGAVPMFQNRQVLASDTNTNDLHYGVYSPIDTTLANSGLAVVDGIELLAYNNDATGYFKQPTVYTYFEGFGWFNSGTPADSTELRAGDAYIIRKPATGGALDSQDWVYLPTYLQ
ncbi:MAG: TIGR02597 family protein [Verrucomicrobiota bacterium]